MAIPIALRLAVVVQVLVPDADGCLAVVLCIVVHRAPIMVHCMPLQHACASALSLPAPRIEHSQLAVGLCRHAAQAAVILPGADAGAALALHLAKLQQPRRGGDEGGPCSVRSHLVI